jgi:hypothetical protein
LARFRVTKEGKNKNRLTAYNMEEFRILSDTAMRKQSCREMEPLIYTLLTMQLTDCPNESKYKAIKLSVCM